MKFFCGLAIQLLSYSLYGNGNEDAKFSVIIGKPVLKHFTTLYPLLRPPSRFIDPHRDNSIDFDEKWNLNELKSKYYIIDLRNISPQLKQAIRWGVEKYAVNRKDESETQSKFAQILVFRTVLQLLVQVPI